MRVCLGEWQKSLDYYGFYLSMVASLGRKYYFAETSNERKDALLARMHMCFQHHVTVLKAILYYFLNLTWGGLPCERSISELIFCVDSMLEGDAHIYAYQWHLVYFCMLLAYHLCFITTMFMREGDRVKPWVWYYFSHRKVPCYFYAILVVVVKPENHKNFGYSVCFGLVVGAWQPLQLISWGHKFVCLLLRVARRVKKRNHLSLSREFDINLESPSRGKLLWLHHSTLGVPVSGTLKNRGMPSENGFCIRWVVYRS
jgi:hypothetical protein